MRSLAQLSHHKETEFISGFCTKWSFPFLIILCKMYFLLLLKNKTICITIQKVFLCNMSSQIHTLCFGDFWHWAFHWGCFQNLSHPSQWFNVFQFSSVQSLSRVWLFATPWITARQASLSITNSWSSLKLMSIESVMPSSHLILCRPLLLLPPIPPSIRVFPTSQLFAWGGQSIGVSALPSFLPKNTQDWSPLGWTGLISLQSKGLSRVFANTTVQKHQFFGAQLSLLENSYQ